MRAMDKRADTAVPRPPRPALDRIIRGIGAAQLIAIGLLWALFGLISTFDIRILPPGTQVPAWLLGPILLVALGGWLAVDPPQRWCRPAIGLGFAVAALWCVLVDHPLQGGIVFRLGETRGLHSTDLAALAIIVSTAAMVDRALRSGWLASRSSTA
jgi:hypothetical protein